MYDYLNQNIIKVRAKILKKKHFYIRDLISIKPFTYKSYSYLKYNQSLFN